MSTGDTVQLFLGLVAGGGAALLASEAIVFRLRRERGKYNTLRKRTRNPELRRIQEQMRAVTAAQSGTAIREHASWKSLRRIEDHREWRREWQSLDPISGADFLRVQQGTRGFTTPHARAAEEDRRRDVLLQAQIEAVLQSQAPKERQLRHKRATTRIVNGNGDVVAEM